MRTLTYNLLALGRTRSGFAHHKSVIEAASRYEVQGEVILVYSSRVAIVDITNIDLETRVWRGNPYSQIPEAVKAYESAIQQIDSKRWVISPPSGVPIIVKVLKGLSIVKGMDCYDIEVDLRYSGQNENKVQETSQVKYKPADDKPRLLVEKAKTKTQNPSLAELLGQAAKN